MTRATRAWTWIATGALVMACAHHVAAQPDPQKEAGQRFKNGLDLHKEADYQGALAEFRRAYELAPNPTVLYNIGQECQNVADYACALSSFERYLAEAKGVTAVRRTEVEKDLKKLRSRVGNVEITVNVDGADVSIDDAPVGKSPLTKPVLVNVGRHRVAAAKDGAGTTSRTLEIASGESKKLGLELGDASSGGAATPAPATTGSAPVGSAAPDSGSPPAGSTAPAPSPIAPVASPQPEPDKPGVPWGAWAVTGALAGGAAVLGYLAISASNDLADKRTSPGQTHQGLADLSSKTKTYALVSDILTGSAVVAGVVSIVLTVRSGSSDKSAAKPATVRIDASPTAVRVTGSF